jgi:hypothetical protein
MVINYHECNKYVYFKPSFIHAEMIFFSFKIRRIVIKKKILMTNFYGLVMDALV